MLSTISIKGVRPLIMHNGSSGLDPRSAANLEKKEITRKRGGNRTEKEEARLAELEAYTSFWLNDENQPTIPPAALRKCIEVAARKGKEGPQVREGLIVVSCDEFKYDRKKYGTTPEELAKSTQFTVGVVVQRSRILRTRAKFDTPWSATFTIETDPELVDQSHVEKWLDIAGRRLGLGDWRPEKSGDYGRFEATTVKWDIG